MEKEIYVIIYNKTNNKDNLGILGENFVKNNTNKANLIIKNKKLKLKDKISINNIKDDKLKIKIILNKNLYNKSYMFKNCDSLIQFSIKDDNEDLERIENKFDENYIESEEKENENLFENYNQIINHNLIIYDNVKQFSFKIISEIYKKDEYTNNTILLSLKDEIILKYFMDVNL